MIYQIKKYFLTILLQKNNNILNLENLNVDNSAKIYNTELNGKITISKGCLINNSIIRGNVTVGKYSAINGPTSFVIAKHHSILIGNYCSIAHNVSIIEFFHNTQTLSTSFLNKKLSGQSSLGDTWSKGKIEIGSDVWIGAGAIILSGVCIGNGAIIGANSVVNTDIPDFAIVAGNPAKILKYRFKHDIINDLQVLKWWEKDIEELGTIKYLLNKPITKEIINEIYAVIHN